MNNETFSVRVGSWEKADHTDEWWLPIRFTVAGEEFDTTLYTTQAPEDIGPGHMMNKVSDLLYILARKVGQRREQMR